MLWERRLGLALPLLPEFCRAEARAMPTMISLAELFTGTHTP